MRKLCSSFAAVALMAGVLAIGGASPVGAVPPDAGEIFNPTNDGTLIQVLSDRPDGQDSFAHLTSVADSDTNDSDVEAFATQAIYVNCPPGGFTASATGPVPPSGCLEIGRDTEPTHPLADDPPTAGSDADLAWEFFWDIPSTFDDTNRDIGVYHCIGEPTGAEGTGAAATANCQLDFVTGVFVDDGLSGTTAASSAELGQWCLDTTGGDNVCDGTFQDFEHGESLPNLAPGEELIVTATSSPDIAVLGLCIDTDADDSAPPGDTCNVTNTDAGAAQPDGTKAYQFEGLTGFNNTEDAFFLFDAISNPTASGACEGNGMGTVCQLDSHYAVTSRAALGTAVMTFNTFDSSCQAPDQEETDPLNTPNPFTLCLFQRLGVPLGDAPFTIELEPTATRPAGSGLVACEAGAGGTETLRDADGDGLFDSCHGRTGPDSVVTGTVSTPGANAAPGTVTITGCYDDEQADRGGPGTSAAQPDLGCVDEASGADPQATGLVSVLSKNYQVGEPVTVRLFVDPEGDGACEGPTFHTIPEGGTVPLVACVFDVDGNISTTENGADLDWFIRVGADDQTDTTFQGAPETETTGGAANATILGEDDGTDIIEVQLNISGGGMDIDQVEIDVEGERPECDDEIDNDGDGDIDFPADNQCESEEDNKEAGGKHKHKSKVTIKGSFKGKVKSPAGVHCTDNRKVKLQKKKGGNWKTVGKDKTGPDGKWKIKKNNPDGKYRAKLKKRKFTEGGTKHVCKGDLSKTVKR